MATGLVNPFAAMAYLMMQFARNVVKASVRTGKTADRVHHIYHGWKHSRQLFAAADQLIDIYPGGLQSIHGYTGLSSGSWGGGNTGIVYHHTVSDCGEVSMLL